MAEKPVDYTVKTPKLGVSTNAADYAKPPLTHQKSCHNYWIVLPSFRRNPGQNHPLDQIIQDGQDRPESRSELIL